QTDSAPGGLCANGQPDALETEPGGYDGNTFKGLFGAFQVFPVLENTPYGGGNAAPPALYDVFAPDATNTPEDGEPWAPASVTNLPPVNETHPAPVPQPPD